MLPNRWRSTSKKRGGGQGVEGGGEGGKLCESPRVQGRCLLANLVKTICLNYTKMNSGSAKAVHLSRYVEKDEGEAEEKNKVLSNVEKGERKAYFENGQWGKGEENDELVDIYNVVVNEVSRYLALFHTPY